jgi:hypothetical protein
MKKRNICRSWLAANGVALDSEAGCHERGTNRMGPTLEPFK